MKKVKKIIIVFIVCVWAHCLFGFAEAHASVTPVILYTDIVAGPTSGGENNNGAYLNIFGYNFGTTGLGITTKVYINNIEVADYKVLQNAKAQPFSVANGPILQQIGVQIGNIGGLAVGSSGVIKVSVNGVDSNTDHSFINQPGDIIYVSLYGSDSTGDGSFNNPYRYVQTPTVDNPVYINWNAGDTIVMMSGDWYDQGNGAYFLNILSTKDGDEPNGLSGHGYMTITGYPGEEVNIFAHGNGTSQWGGIRAPGTSFPDKNNYFVVSNLNIHCDDNDGLDNIGDGGIQNNYSGDYWRIVNNYLTADVTRLIRAGGISGSLRNSVVYGNKLDKIGGGTEMHDIYLYNTSHDSEIAYNYFSTNPTAGSGVQFYDDSTFDSMSVHHNYFNGIGKHAINLATTGLTNFEAYNNIVKDAYEAGVRTGVYTLVNNAYITNNTFYNCTRGMSPVRGCIFNTAQFLDENKTFHFENNIIHMYSTNGWYYYPYTTPDTGIFFDNNLYYHGNVSTIPAREINEVIGDPKFMNIGVDSENLAIQLSSAAKDSAKNPSVAVSNDFIFTLRPVNGVYDIGAFEYVSTEETCFDNIQNQDETGVDCGGVCEACVVPTTYDLTNFISAITNWLGIGNATSDVNSDGVVNSRDLGVMMSGWE